MNKTEKALLKLQGARNLLLTIDDDDQGEGSEEDGNSYDTTEGSEEEFELKINWKNEMLRIVSCEVTL